MVAEHGTHKPSKIGAARLNFRRGTSMRSRAWWLGGTGKAGTAGD
jgi:hypothetical protein